jgi:hypothetical protein
LKFILLIVLFFVSFNALAQSPISEIMGPFLPGTEPKMPLQGESEAPKIIEGTGIRPWNLSEAQRTTFTWVGGLMVPSIALAQGLINWGWGKNSKKFGIQSEGWFKMDTYAGGADKTGHLLSHYVQKRFYSWLSSKIGYDESTSNLHGVLAASLTGLMIEVGDGFSRYRFCPQDIVSDALGIALAYFVDKHPKLDDLIGLRWEYWPSQDWMDKRTKSKLDFPSDHSGQKFFLSLKAKGIPPLAENWYTKYLTLDLGYYVRGYSPNYSTNTKVQYFTYGAGINLGELAKDFGPKNGLGEVLSGIFKYWIPPGTVLTGKSEIDQAPVKL